MVLEQLDNLSRKQVDLESNDEPSTVHDHWTSPLQAKRCHKQNSFLTCEYQGGRVVKALDLRSNVRMHTWVRTPFLVWEPGPFFFFFFYNIYLRSTLKGMAFRTLLQQLNCFFICYSTKKNANIFLPVIIFLPFVWCVQTFSKASLCTVPSIVNSLSPSCTTYLHVLLSMK